MRTRYDKYKIYQMLEHSGEEIYCDTEYTKRDAQKMVAHLHRKYNDDGYVVYGKKYGDLYFVAADAKYKRIKFGGDYE